jgi:hypothetical protein
LLLDELLGARKLCAAGCLLLLLAHAQLGEELPAARDERFAEGEGAAFGVGSCDELGELGRLVCSLFLGGEHRRGVDHAHGVVERRRERAQTGAHELGRRGLDGGVARRGGARSCGVGLVRGKGLVDKGDGFGGMVDADAELAAAGAAHEVGLHLFGAKVVEGLDEVEEGAHFDRAVDLGELGEETREECAREEGAVACIGGVAGAEGVEDGRGGSAEGEGVKGGFEQAVEGLDQGGREPEDVSREL